MTGPAKTQYWIGPSGWSYEDWYGIVYPPRKSRGFRPLARIGQLFNAVEVNASFYRIPMSRMTSAWPPLVPDRFRFAFKLTQDFTHRRDSFPPPKTVRAFHDGVQPIRDAGLLGPLLLQFPWSFRYSAESVAWLERLAEAFAYFERFIEVRHTSWAAPEALAALADAGKYCNIDQPRLPRNLGPTEHVFGRSAYVRLHGRNARNWFADNVPSHERYNYLYDEDALREWVARINAMAAQAENIYVFANNHYRGQGPANALEIRAMLEDTRVNVPDELLAAYPRLARIAHPPDQPGLFPPHSG